MIANTDILLRLVVAAALGSLIGLERERLVWTAGLRTHMLVCVGSALLMMVSAFGFGDVLGRSNVALDPSRVAAQVVSGIGFLGAGTILLRREVVRGLTTAASLWSVAAIGLAVGGGMFAAAVIATVLILLILAGLKPIEVRLWKRAHLTSQLQLGFDGPAVTLATLEEARGPVGVKNLRVERGSNPEDDQIQLTLHPASREDLLAAVERLRAIEGVQTVRLDSGKNGAGE